MKGLSEIMGNKMVTFSVNMKIELEVDDRRMHLRTLAIKGWNDAMFLKITEHAVLYLPHIEHIEKWLSGQFPESVKVIGENDD